MAAYVGSTLLFVVCGLIGGLFETDDKSLAAGTKALFFGLIGVGGLLVAAQAFAAKECGLGESCVLPIFLLLVFYVLAAMAGYAIAGGLKTLWRTGDHVADASYAQPLLYQHMSDAAPPPADPRSYTRAEVDAYRPPACECCGSPSFMNWKLVGLTTDAEPRWIPTGRLCSHHDCSN